ncbi:MAG TPA: hypothetical protein VF171_08940, partial [Trueperaceae bacterium]
MTRTLDMMGRAIADTATQLGSILAGMPWDWLGWLLAGLLLLALFSRYAGRGLRAAAGPSVLVSLGEILVRELAEEGGAVSLVNELRLTVSNLGDVPVQILELAVSTDRMSAPVTAEVAELVRPSASLRFRTRLDKIVGETGSLSLYLYAPGTARRYFRLTAGLEWEPWNGRYKVSPVEQVVRPSRALPSVGDRQRRRQAWHERRREEEARL